MNKAIIKEQNPIEQQHEVTERYEMEGGVGVSGGNYGVYGSHTKIMYFKTDGFGRQLLVTT